MTAAGDVSLGVAYSQVGNTENPPNSNVCSPYTDPWGAGAWCAMFVSWCYEAAGFPFPPLNGPHGFSYVPAGTTYCYTTPGANVGEGGVERGDWLCFSWEPWHIEGGVAVCSYGAYAGTPAGDHTGFFAGWTDGPYMRTVEGNTSQSSWDNGGAVMERSDRYTGQVCAYGRHPALGAGGGGGPVVVTTYSLNDDRIDLVGVNTEGHIYHKWYEAGQPHWQPGRDTDPGGWEHLTSGLPKEALAANTSVSCQWFGDQFQVFYARRDGQVGQLFIGGATGGWVRTAIAGNVSGIAAAVRSKLVQTS